MSLSNAVIKTGATWSSSGGSDLTFAPDGRSVKDGISLVVPADTNLILRRSLECRAILPALASSSATYAKLGRNTLSYRIPFVAADGKLYLQHIKIETSFHAEYGGKNGALSDATAFFGDSDFTSFWQSSIVT